MKAFLSVIIFGILTTASVFADESLDQIKTQLENGALKDLIQSGQVKIQVKKEVSQNPYKLELDPTEKRNDDGLVTEKAGFEIRYSVYNDGRNGRVEERSLLSCLRYASDHVAALISLDPVNKPADQRQTRIRKDLGYEKIYIQLSNSGVDPDYLEKDGNKYLLFKFRDNPRCDFKTASQLDMWVIQQMLKRAVGNINGVTFSTGSIRGSLKAQ